MYCQSTWVYYSTCAQYDEEGGRHHFLSWLSDHNLGQPLEEDDDSDTFYPHQLPLLDDDSTQGAANNTSQAVSVPQGEQRGR